MKRRVVITGVGAITPIGIGKDEFWNNLVAGKSGVGPITQFDASEYGTRIAGEVKARSLFLWKFRICRQARFPLLLALKAPTWLL